MISALPISAADLLEGLDGPAAVLGPDLSAGPLAANAAFLALPETERRRAADPACEDWRARALPSGARLVQPDRRRTGAARRADVMATLSHEIRTPLNGVLGMAGLLEGTRLEATQRAYLATLKDSGDHLLNLVGSVLDWARLDAGRIAVEPGAVDLERLLQGVAELLSPQAHAKGIEIAWAVEGPLREVTADDGRLRQILFNLAGNAVKMTDAGGVRLLARTFPGGGTGPGGGARLRLEVADSGPGLSPQAQINIFEAFEQTPEGVRAGGAGLGLAIVRGLAEALGGEVSVASAPGEGAVFAFGMPLGASLSAAPDPSPSLAGRVVAVVSASAVVFEAAALQLQSLGAQVVRVESLKAVDHLPSPADLVLFDAPGGRLPAPPRVAPTLVLVTPEARGRLTRVRAQGYAGWLIKPLRRVSLEARALAVLAGDAAAEGASVPTPSDDERLQSPAAPLSLTVLLAEDNPVNALLARTLLKRLGCRVDLATTGIEAVEAARATPYDLILLDLRMPGMGGLAAARAIREAGLTTRIAALTANAFDEDRRACLDAGMDAFLTKPLEIAALTALLGDCARRWAA
ncbi:response regulator [soil metagenome]